MHELKSQAAYYVGSINKLKVWCGHLDGPNTLSTGIQSLKQEEFFYPLMFLQKHC